MPNLKPYQLKVKNRIYDIVPANGNDKAHWQIHYKGKPQGIFCETKKDVVNFLAKIRNVKKSKVKEHG